MNPANKNGFDSLHTLELPEKNRTTDKEIIAIAKKEERIVISKDYDFLELFILRKEPKKLIIIKTGNASNRIMMKLFVDNLQTIVTMLSRSNLLEIHKNKIVEQ